MREMPGPTVTRERCSGCPTRAGQPGASCRRSSRDTHEKAGPEGGISSGPAAVNACYGHLPKTLQAEALVQRLGDLGGVIGAA